MKETDRQRERYGDKGNDKYFRGRERQIETQTVRGKERVSKRETEKDKERMAKRDRD